MTRYAQLYALSLLILALLPTQCALAQTPGVRRLEVHIPPEYALPVPAALKTTFPKGLPPGLGYGLTFVMRQPDGSMLFYGLTGRGPTVSGPHVRLQAEQPPAPSTVYLTPEYAPSLVALRVSEKAADVVGIWPLRDSTGQPVRGLPPKIDLQAGGVPLGFGLDRLPPESRGMFPGGVAKDNQLGCLWIGEDYGPSLLKVAVGDGRILKRFVPGEGLMEPIPGDSVRMNVSGLCASDSGKLYATLRHPQHVAGVAAQFVRIVEFDPENERVRHFACPIDKNEYQSLDQVEVSDITYVAENRFLVLEQGPGKEGNWLSRVFVLDVARATNIRRAVNDQGQPVEVVGSSAEWDALGLRMARKILALDLTGAGLSGAKAGCMTLLPGQTTLAVMSGGGFGLLPTVENPAKDASGKVLDSPSDYVLDSAKRLTVAGAPTQARLAFKSDNTGAGAWMWLFELPKKPSEYKVTWTGGLPSAPPGTPPGAAPAPPPPAPAPPAH